jgi:hypothetical protein
VNFRKILSGTKPFLVFSILTLLTQIGRVVYLIVLVFSKKYRWNTVRAFIIFLGFYGVISFLIVPRIAPYFGRVQIPSTKYIQPASFISVLMNRNYVDLELEDYLERTEKKLEANNLFILYLDANFPFIDGFPLFPHLSHSDGKKIDISLLYKNTEGKIVQKVKSNSGYGVFEEPKTSELNQTEICKSKGYYQYDYPKYLTLGKINSNLEFAERKTKKLINVLLEDPVVEKIFIEPHLKQRLKLSHPKIRFHGCRAVRHDDHIHLQIK